MNTQKEQTEINHFNLTHKSFIEDNIIKPDHKIDLSTKKKKHKAKKISKKKIKFCEPKITIFEDGGDNISLFDLIPIDSDENQIYEKLTLDIKKEFSNSKHNEISSTRKSKIPNKNKVSYEYIKNDIIPDNKIQKKKIQNYKSAFKKFIPDSVPNTITSLLNVNQEKKEDKLIIPIFANSGDKISVTGKSNNIFFLNNKIKRNNNGLLLYMPPHQYYNVFQNSNFISPFQNFCK